MISLYKAITKKIKKIFFNPYKFIGVSSFQIKKLKHQNYNTPGKIKIFGKPFNYLHPPEVIYSLKEFFINNIYKIKFDTEKPKIIDCGANIGFSIIALKKQYPNAHIIAFEPDVKNLELLKKNILHLSNISIENKAVWNEETVLQFNMTGTQGSSSQIGNDYQLKNVNAVKLSKYLNERIDFLKIDIEGAEYEVLKSCKHKLYNVQNLFVEYHGVFENQFRFYEIIELLREEKFKIYIKEADNIYPTPFYIEQRHKFDLQLNIFAFR